MERLREQRQRQRAVVADRVVQRVEPERVAGLERHSFDREIVIKALAESQDSQSEILTTNAYKVALERGVENPSQLVGQLVTEEYGAELVKMRERYYRFKDSLFAAYVKAHPQILKSDLTDEWLLPLELPSPET